MKSRMKWIGIVGLILVIAGVTAVQARGHRRGHHHFAGPRFEALDLTQEQKDELKSLRSEGQKKMIQLRADAKLAHVELRELMQQKNPNQRAVTKAVEKVNDTRSKITMNRVQQKLSMNKILTEEQLQKLEEMPKRRRGHRGKRGFHGRGGHGMGMGDGASESTVVESSLSRI